MKQLTLCAVFMFLLGAEYVKSACIEATFGPCDYDDPNHPAHECISSLNARIQEAIKSDCLAHEGDDQTDAFQQNIELLCQAKGHPLSQVEICPKLYPTDPFPMCGFEDENHPAHDCYSQMSPMIQDSVQADCLAYDGTPDMDDFIKNMETLCAAKGVAILPLSKDKIAPLCTAPEFGMCEYDNEAHPVHDCYSALSTQIQISMTSDCLQFEGTEDLDSFNQNIDVLCEAKGTPVLPPEPCSRILPLGPTSPPFGICDFDNSNHPANDCYNLMSSQIQQSLIDDCYEYEGSSDQDDLLNNIEVLCEAKGAPVTPAK